jgi:glucokinase
MGKVCFGIDIGGTTVKLGFFTQEGELQDKWEIPTRTEHSGDYILEDVAKSIDLFITDNNINREDIIGLGIGVPGPVMEDGTVLGCVNLGWSVFNVAKKMEELTGFKTRVNNDANVAALGEMWQGGGKGYKSLIMVTLGTGVGGGVIVNNEIITGAKGAAGEIGHIKVNIKEENTCGCGNRGCLEQYASATGVVREAKRLLDKTSEESSLRTLEDITAKDIFDHAKHGDAIAKELVEILGEYLGLALSNVAAVVDPEVFVIGGGVSKAGDILISTIEKHYDNNSMFALKNKKFELAKLGNDAGIYGSAKLVL